MNEYKFDILGLDCPNCASKLENALIDSKEFESVNLSFINKKLIVKCDKEKDEVINLINKVINKVEPDAYLASDVNKHKHHEHHDHHDHHNHCHDKHGHCHNHDHDEYKKMKKDMDIIYMIISIFLLVLGYLLGTLKGLEIISVVILLGSYIVASYDILYKSFRSISKGHVFDENFLMAIASIGAICIGEYHEAILVILLYKLGEMFQDYAINNSKRSIKSLLELKVDIVHLLKEDKIIDVDPLEVKEGDIILVLTGEKVPLDGVIYEGISSFDPSRITGESKPLDLQVNDEVSSGYINISSLVKIKVLKTYKNSNVSLIIKMLEESVEKKSNNEKFITKFAKYYTPIVVVLAFLIVLIPLILSIFSLINNFEISYYISKALVFLVVSCPCALVLSIPLAFFAGIGRCSKDGILVKGSNYLEMMSKVDTIIFDKTGTITKGNFKVSSIESLNKEETLRIAYLLDYYSTHPIAKAIKEEFIENSITYSLEDVSELSDLIGLGIKAKVKGKEALVGNEKLMQEYNIEYNKTNYIGSVVYVAYDHQYLGSIVIKDEIKENVKKEINKINSQNIYTMMLSGDNDNVTNEVYLETNIKEYHSNLLPLEKVQVIKEVMNNKKDKHYVVFVGDGINDAPALKTVDVGISMGNKGSDLAIESSDIVISDDSISKVNDLIDISKITNKIVKENIIFSIGIKVIVMILSLFGLANILLGIFADVGVMVLAVLNAMRILLIKKKA